MRLSLVLFAFTVGAVSLCGQPVNMYGHITGSGVPSGPCNHGERYFRSDVPEVYTCFNGAWVQTYPIAGPTGPQGPAGADGAAGPQGDPGAQGETGAAGATGSQGPQGEPGTAGAAGPQGDAGPNGDTGPQGSQGVPGDPGAKGDKGDAGDQGIQGPQGEPGASGLGYTINVQALTSSPADNVTVYFGMLPKAPTTTANISKVYIRKAGTIKIAQVYCYSGTAGTAEAWSLYIRLNNTTDTLIATLSVSASERIFTNSTLNIAVAAGDYVEIKGVQPTWATNPLTTIYGGYLYIE